MNSVPPSTPMTDFDRSPLLGILADKRCFSSDGEQAHVPLQMRAQSLKVLQTRPQMSAASNLYAPYEYAGYPCHRWMARGEGLRDQPIPLFDALPLAQVADHVQGRYLKSRHGR